MLILGIWTHRQPEHVPIGLEVGQMPSLHNSSRNAPLALDRRIFSRRFLEQGYG